MTSTIELYYFPASFYSQKVYLTLLEKELSFKEKLVFIHFGEQYQEWYLRLNPNGQVPVIKNGNDVVYDSEVIIDYLDKEFSSGSSLVPDLSTPLGQRVSESRKWLDAVPVALLSFGPIIFPEFMPKENNFPKMFLQMAKADKMKKDLEDKIADFKMKQKNNPSLHEALEKKIEQSEWRLKNLFEKEKIGQVIQDLDGTFDRMESELQKLQKENGTEAVWLCGTKFTAADITAAILFNRLKMIGLDRKYYSATRWSRVAAYRDRLYARPSIKRLVVDLSDDRVSKLMKRKFATTTAKKVTKVVLGVGLIAAIAYGVKTYMNRT